jgi:hypothetical protein
MLALSMTSAMTISLVNAATYEVIDIDDASVKYTYAQHANNTGDSVLSGTNGFNFPVQFDQLDEDDFSTIQAYANANSSRFRELEPIENIDALKAGNPTANDLTWTVKWLETKSTDYSYQKFDGTIALLNTGQSSEEIVIFDNNVLLPQSRSTVDIVKGITDSGWLYGSASAPYLPQSFTDSTGIESILWYRKFSSRAFFSDDRGVNVYEIKPPTENNTDTEKNHGGVSGILDLNEAQVAVGYMSTTMAASFQEIIESATESQGCANPDFIANLPKEVCVQVYRDDAENNPYQIRAFKAVVNGNGESTIDNLGLLVTPHADDVRSFESYAQAINDEGVVVGFSHAWIDESQTTPVSNQSRSLYAAVFKDGAITSFAKDHSIHFDSRAYDISNAGIATGHVSMAISGKLRTKFYYIDTTNVDEMELVIPTDFFDSSSSTARSINDNGFIVGEGEVETHTDSTQNPRRTHAFLYDINNDVFQDINDLIACDSQYSIVEARHINEDNIISASAVYKVQRQDATGELMFDVDGEALMEDIVRAVRLKPIEDDEQVCSREEEGKVIREGASFGLLSLLTLLIVGIRRRLYSTQ